jgi:inner membrane protein
MASVGHVAVGIAAARAHQRTGRAPSWRSVALWSALSLLPDADVIGFSLGVQYGDPWGHRGATHSLAMAVVAGVCVGLAARRFNHPFRRTAIFATAVLASHGLLDTMTDGGLGCALFWPFDLTRYFAPWRPIPVAPIGLAFLSPYGLIVSAIEIALFGPLFFYALRPRRLEGRRVVAGVLLVLWAGSIWLIASTDPVRETIVGVVLREDTAYATGFSEPAFRTIAAGQSAQHVHDRLGAPVGESWVYPSPSERAAATSAASLDGCRAIRFESDAVAAAFNRDACDRMGIVAGTPLNAVRQRLGPPPESCWRYSWSPGGAHYRVRDVCFVASSVDTVIRGWR